MSQHTGYIQQGSLRVAQVLHQFVARELTPGTGVDPGSFWRSLESIVSELAPRNRELLRIRETMQSRIDQWHREHRDYHPAEYQQFLRTIGYIQPDPEPFRVGTINVDTEIITAGPQLVVPVMNARYALNAANARWGSLYDALYGTDVIEDTVTEEGGTGRSSAYDPMRGARVIAYGRDFLDQHLAPATGSHRDVTEYQLVDSQLRLALADGTTTCLREPEKFIGFRTAGSARIQLFRNHGLHIELHIDPAHAVGALDSAHVSDIVLEAALTTIQDCEDSVAAVDADDKVQVYRNWLGLMKGDLQERVNKGGTAFVRRLNEDRTYTKLGGRHFSLPGRSLLLVRNVGHLMTSDAVVNADGYEIPEGILDGLVTVLAALHDLNGSSPIRNSRSGSIYIVKPKMHGPDEVAFACTLFDRIEEAFSLARHTVKIGIMDEERRTSVNLMACIELARERIIFINTGFLDRTGDEIHTNMEAGAVVRKADMKQQPWIKAYESRNVAIGLHCGLAGRGQIGKGMWAMPDEMATMLQQKLAHPLSGASCAWVPSPTAAVLHAIHYHQVSVRAVQEQMLPLPPAPIDQLLMPPLATGRGTAEELQQELDNNAQGLLGYVVRWIEYGTGCSKVPDINDIGLMEDRATLRISSQHLANWLRHGVVSAELVMETLQRMARVVDRQNAGDAQYRPMSADYDNSIAFQTACELVFRGCEQPCGYTEPILHRRRLEFKARMRQESL